MNEAAEVFCGFVNSQSVDVSGSDTAEHEETEVCVVDFDVFKPVSTAANLLMP
ncbi:MAG: hypothetical protein VX416_01895 [Pseudomonadota bacterium]|nr:hypothetical protein [Pseudomonadota bacterium]